MLDQIDLVAELLCRREPARRQLAHEIGVALVRGDEGPHEELAAHAPARLALLSDRHPFLGV